MARWHKDLPGLCPTSTWMAYDPLMPSKPRVARSAALADSEKITINMGFVDLGHVDLLVAEGFYSNRTDFIRTAIRNQISVHQDALRQVVARKTLVLGLQHFTRK